jgi:aquaporin Z
MSMNPARSLGSASWAGTWMDQWVYLVAPLAGMISAGLLCARWKPRAHCAKLHHDNPYRCIFCGANS